MDSMSKDHVCTEACDHSKADDGMGPGEAEANEPTDSDSEGNN